jgi:hypothetical protein
MKFESDAAHISTMNEDIFCPPQDQQIAEFCKPCPITTSEKPLDEPPIVNICTACNAAMVVVGQYHVCQYCGQEKIIDQDISETHPLGQPNYSSEYTTLKLSGRGSYVYQRSLIRCCHTHQPSRRANILKDMTKWNNECDKYRLPKNVIQQASEMFSTIRDAGYVYRGGSREGVMGNCIYYACYAAGITKTPAEIAQFTGISEKFISQGSRILHKLHELGVINIPTVINPISDYLDRFMSILMIDIPRYKPFLLEMLETASKNKLHVIYDSKNLTKCAGVLYLLADRIPHMQQRLTKEEIEKCCQTSRTTFVKYTEMMLSYWRLFKAVYKRHRIPMRDAWAGEAHRENIQKCHVKKKKRGVRVLRKKIVGQLISR